jgi:hypothetical protein
MRTTNHIGGAVRRAATLLAVAGLVLAATPALAGQAGLAQVRRATAAFHDVAAAEAEGYEEFLPCFENPGVGGMGQHYVDLAATFDDGGAVEATHPEALVYEVRPDGRLKLVAVEYIVPADFVDPANPPELFGEHFHENTSLGVWVLHAWIWQANPTGVFEDWNPRIGGCPA